MPSIVYGVLDVHPSHRIEAPAPARQAADDRPDACTQCHVDETRTWAVRERARLFGAEHGAPASEARTSGDDLSEVERQLFRGDPIQRTLAAAALGRPAHDGARARRLALLLEVMEHDPYPAIRHLAQRSARRLAAREAALAAFIPESAPAERTRALAALRARFPLPAAQGPAIQALRASAQERAIEIGE
jgi:hypothetical protein